MIVTIVMINYLKASDEICDTLIVKRGCLCPGSSIVYQCAVTGSVQGLTVWQVSGCKQDIVLYHRDFVNQHSQDCQNVDGEGISILNHTCYVSELTIIDANNIQFGGNVVCLSDIGSQTIIDNLTLPTPISKSLCPSYASFFTYSYPNYYCKA